MQELRFSSVELSYGQHEQSLLAVQGLSFDVRGGESVAIIGPSGCGKSSTLRLAAGLLQPTAGSVTIDGATASKPRPTTALILQDFGLLPWKTVMANAELGLTIRHMPREQRRQRALEALELTGLSDFVDAYPSELSGGMKQRLALARSLAIDVDLMLMDEPLSALDALLREQLQDTLLELWQREGYAQVLVTHSIEEAVFLGQRVFVMSPRPGRVEAVIDNPDVGMDGYRTSDAFFARCNAVRQALRLASTSEQAPAPADDALGQEADHA